MAFPRQSSAQRFPYFQNGAATLKGREAPGTRLRFLRDTDTRPWRKPYHFEPRRSFWRKT